MKKIKTVFARDSQDRSRVTDVVTPGCEWVFAGEGQALRKYDGTCVMLDTQGNWWARREVKPGKAFPPDFIIEQHDNITGKFVGWEPIESSPFIKAWREATENAYEVGDDEFPPGTYELIGPKVQGNPERAEHHVLVRHAAAAAIDWPVTSAESVRTLVREVARIGWEGIVWHHPDGRMAKIKARDYGFDVTAEEDRS